VSVVNRFKVTLEGVDLGVFAETEFTLNDAFVLEATTGLTVLEMLAGITPRKAKALQALVWFMKFKQGSPDHISTINFKLVDLKWEAVADPTPASDSEQEVTVPDVTGTSESSPTSAI
jgi:hypothetical protein